MTTPSIHFDTVVYYQDEQEQALTVGTAAWFTWLNTVTTFTFNSDEGSFTAHKEQAGNKRGGEYWRAYRSRGGKLHRAYLGKSEALTLERLQAAAATLAGGKHVIGREHEIAEVTALLRSPDVRLVTLTGTGGVGKTRLAVQVAHNLLNDFADGAYFVSLAPVSDPELVVPTIARALGVKEVRNQPIFDLLKTSLQEKHLLLLLDNFEQVAAAAPLLSELLSTCPFLKLIVTSREGLRLLSEQRFQVPPLTIPELESLPSTEALSRYPAVMLFMCRAQAVKPDFIINDANAHAIAEICIRLDGLPLAIELAAARIYLLPPRALLARLGRKLQILTRRASDLPERQQTLRTTIKWSYDLLYGEQQRLFRQLSVFVDGCPLEAVESVSTALGADPVDVLDEVTSLLEKNLILQQEQEDGEPRLRMLETVREYGLECLAANAEEEITRNAHASYYLAKAEETEPKLWSEQQVVSLQRLEHELENLRAALRWLIEREETEKALRLAGALASFTSFWSIHGHVSEGRSWLKRALASSGQASALVRAKAFYGGGTLAHNQSDYDEAAAMFEESLKLFREQQDLRGIAFSLNGLGYVARRKGDYAKAQNFYTEVLARFRALGERQGICETLLLLASLTSNQGDYAGAQTMCEESLMIAREGGDKLKLAVSLLGLSGPLLYQGDYQGARFRAEESLAFFKELGHRTRIANALTQLGHIANLQGNYAEAQALLEEGLAIAREQGAMWLVGSALGGLVHLYYQQGNYAKARTLAEENLAIARKMNAGENMAYALENLAKVVATQGQPMWATRLWGTAETLRKAINIPLPPIVQLLQEQAMAMTRTQLGNSLFEATLAEGRNMTPEQAIAARGKERNSTPATAALNSFVGLTKREREVLRLIAMGLTDAQIAEKLVISPHTVNAHTRSIYSKLGVTSRSAATRYAVEQKLI